MAKSATYGPGIGLPESSIAAGSVDSVLVGVRHGPAKLSRRRRPFLFGVELVERSDAMDASLAQRRGAYLWALSSSRPARRAKGLFSSKTGEAPLEGTYSCGLGLAKRSGTNEVPLAQRRCAANAFEILDVNCPCFCLRHAAFDRDMQVELRGLGGLPSYFQIVARQRLLRTGSL